MGATIEQAECLEWLRRQPDDSVDLVMCSPPYEAARLYGEVQFKLRGQDWVDWAVERYLECVRISRGLVAWVVEGQTRQFRWSATPALLMADLHRAGVKLRKPPIFHRVGICGSGGPDWWRNDYEFCVCSTKGKLPWSDNTATGHPPKWAPGGEMSHRLSSGARCNKWGAGRNNTVGPRKPDGSRAGNSGSPRKNWGVGGRMPETRNGDAVRVKAQTRRKANGERPMDGLYTEPAIANPGNVIKCKVGGGMMGDNLAHENEAPYPEKLVESFVLCFCPPGGVVCDPFIGSGTTAAVALRHNRNFVGCDIRQSQVELTRRRIAEVQPLLM